MTRSPARAAARPASASRGGRVVQGGDVGLEVFLAPDAVALVVDAARVGQELAYRDWSLGAVDARQQVGDDIVQRGSPRSTASRTRVATIGFVIVAIRKRVSSVIGVPAVSAVPEAANVRTPSRTDGQRPGAPYPGGSVETAWTLVVGAPVGGSGR